MGYFIIHPYFDAMPRTPGSKNRDHEQTRTQLLSAMRPLLAAPGGLRRSFRELAAAAQVEPRTLRHYFTDRDGLLRALFEHDHRIGLGALAQVAEGPLGPVRQSLRQTLEFVRRGFLHGGLRDVHVVGIGAGFEQPSLGKAYLGELLEPTLQSLERRIERHLTAGDLTPCNARHAALQLLGSALLVFLHQHSLGGADCRKLNEAAFLDDLVNDFVKAHEP
jgi:AcrR family transcriptional regulator